MFKTTLQRLNPAVDPALRKGLAAEQLRMVRAHTRLGTLVASAFAVLLALHLGGGAGLRWVYAWLAIKLVVAGYRIFQGTRNEGAEPEQVVNSQRQIDTWLVIDGAVWGAAGFALMASPIPMASLVGAVMACVSCVATFGLQFSLRSTAAYVVPITAPTAAGLLGRGDDFGWVGGLGLLMLLALQLATARSAQLRLLDGLMLRLRAEALAVEKDEALKLALRQSAVKTQFLGNISHELRTPLHGILGLARLLHLEAHDRAVARRVELIESSGTHLLSLINDLLDIARLDAGHFAMRSEAFDLIEQVDHLAGVYAVRAEDKGLAFKLSVALPRPCRVQGDPARFRQVLHNLLGNAVKFTQQGGIALSVSRDAATGMVRTEVKDSGGGIAKDDLAHVFEAFRQSGSATARPFEGAGLGLTIARDIALAMGGDIAIDSQVGAGTTLVFTAKLVDAGSESSPGALHERGKHEAQTSGPGTEAGLPRLVLIAEDDDVNAIIALAYLEHVGVRAERVINGKEAVRHALREVNRPELVLMDCRMPTMDGYAATREIRAQEHTLGLARLPIVALTATASDSDRQKCLDAGMDDFLAKPYTRDALTLMLRQWGPAAAAGANPLDR
jgi:two-component system, sensor histidine kinase